MKLEKYFIEDLFVLWKKKLLLKFVLRMTWIVNHCGDCYKVERRQLMITKNYLRGGEVQGP